MRDRPNVVIIFLFAGLGAMKEICELSMLWVISCSHYCYVACYSFIKSN